MPESLTPQERCDSPPCCRKTGPTSILFRAAKGGHFRRTCRRLASSQNLPPTRQFAEATGSMVPRRLATTRHLSLQRWKFGQRNENTQRPRYTSNTLDMPRSLERDDHLVHGWCGNAEVPLNVRLGRRAAVDLAVVKDEREVLALARRECGFHRCVRTKGSNVRHERQPEAGEACWRMSARWSG